MTQIFFNTWNNETKEKAANRATELAGKIFNCKTKNAKQSSRLQRVYRIRASLFCTRVQAFCLTLLSRTIMCCDNNILCVKPFKLFGPTLVFDEAMILPFVILLLVFFRKVILTLVRDYGIVIDQR